MPLGLQVLSWHLTQQIVSNGCELQPLCVPEPFQTQRTSSQKIQVLLIFVYDLRQCGSVKCAGLHEWKMFSKHQVFFPAVMGGLCEPRMKKGLINIHLLISVKYFSLTNVFTTTLFVRKINQRTGFSPPYAESSCFFWLMLWHLFWKETSISEGSRQKHVSHTELPGKNTKLCKHSGIADQNKSYVARCKVSAWKPTMTMCSVETENSM